MTETSTYKELLDAGVHFGHQKRKWDPHMAPYIFMEKNGIHIIDLNKTLRKLNEAASALKQIAKSGKKILFVATKKQAKSIVEEEAKTVNMPFVTERWLGGMLTNFATIRKSIKKMNSIDKMMADEATVISLSKKEKLKITRDRAKLEKMLGGFAQLNRLPAALFIVDIKKEHIAVQEALKLNIPTFAMVDSNSDPRKVDFVIPANDDSSKSISHIINKIAVAIAEGLEERKQLKEIDTAKKSDEESNEDENLHDKTDDIDSDSENTEMITDSEETLNEKKNKKELTGSSSSKKIIKRPFTKKEKESV